MKIHSVLQDFFVLDPHALRHIYNTYSFSIWFTDPNKLGDKIQVSIKDSKYIMRLYAYRDLVDYKITFIPEANKLFLNSIKTLNIENNEQCVIEGFMDINSEEQFFQHTLINDVADITYEDLSKLKELYIQCHEIAKEKLNAK